MDGWKKRIFNELAKVIGQEGIKLLRQQAVAAAKKLIHGLRRLLFLNYILMISCFLTAFSLFFSLYLASLQLSQNRVLTFTWPLAVCLGLFVLFSSLLGFTVREKTWIRAFRLEEWGGERNMDPFAPEIDYDTVADIVEEILEKKLKSARYRRSPTSSKKRKH